MSVTIVTTEFKFKPDTITVRVGERVRVTLDNSKDTLKHDMHQSALNIHVEADTGQKVMFEFTPTKVGTFDLICDVPGQRRRDGRQDHRSAMTGIASSMKRSIIDAEWNSMTSPSNSVEQEHNCWLTIARAAWFIAALVSLDGESHWLEGAMLLVVYTILGLAFFFLPVTR